MNEEFWELIGTKRKFEPNCHLIWTTGKNFDEIETPDGYQILKSEYIIRGLNKYARVFFVNTVPVIAELYKNTKTKEISYYFAGTPIEKVKKLTKSKS